MQTIKDDIWRRNNAAKNAMSSIRELLRIYTHKGAIRPDLSKIVLNNPYVSRCLLRNILNYCVDVYKMLPEIPFEVTYIRKMYHDFIDQDQYIDRFDGDDECVISNRDIHVMIKALNNLDNDLRKIIHER